MHKFYFLFLISYFSLFALDITIAPSKTDTISKDEINTFINIIKKRKMNIDYDIAKEEVAKNRALADAYLEKSSNAKKRIQEGKLLFEEELKDLLVQEHLDKLKISDEVLLSYYKTHKDDYYNLKEIIFNSYRFSTFEDAMKFYTLYNENISNITETKIASQKSTLKLHNLSPQVKILLRNTKEENYITSPQKFSKNYIIFHVLSITPDGMAPFKEVENDIKSKLTKKMKRDTLDSLLQKYYEVEN